MPSAIYLDLLTTNVSFEVWASAVPPELRPAPLVRPPNPQNIHALPESAICNLLI